MTEGEQGPASVRELVTSRTAREEGEASDELPSWLKVVGSGDWSSSWVVVVSDVLHAWWKEAAIGARLVWSEVASEVVLGSVQELELERALGYSCDVHVGRRQ